MGKKLDALLGRNVNNSKIKTLLKLAIARIIILKKYRRVRVDQARSDVHQLLQLGAHDRALLRVEEVIKERNMLDAFVMIEGYCHLLIERITMIKKNRECPEDLKEAVLGLLFAASRCGDLPELQKIRGIFTSIYGKEFATHAVDLPSKCGVNPKVVRKLSMRQSSSGSKLEVLNEIASESGITLHLNDYILNITEEKAEVNQHQEQPIADKLAKMNEPELADYNHDVNGTKEKEETFSNSMKARITYRDVADAAEDAFESAAYAAAAARAAVELSQSKSRLHIYSEIEEPKDGYGFHKIYPIDGSNFESEVEETEQNGYKNREKELENIKKKTGIGRTSSASSFSSDGDNLYSDRTFSNLMWEIPKATDPNSTVDDFLNETEDVIQQESPKWISLRSGANSMAYYPDGTPNTKCILKHTSIMRKPVSVRTR